MRAKFARPQSPLSSLRRFTQPREQQEHCALCHAPVHEEHSHLFEVSSRRLQCVCEPCAILFSNAVAPRFRRVPRQVEQLADFQIADLQWEAFGLPINLAFFVFSSMAQRIVSYYPSPGGAVESAPPPAAWDDLLVDNPRLRNLQPDIEALLINRLGKQREQFLLGIDQAYKLTGIVRTHWQGFSGGDAVWNELDRFLEGLRKRSTSIGERTHA
jgi:hypothetical protein